MGTRTVHTTQEQAENAALIAAVAAKRGLPSRAVAIALTSAYQQSDLTNVAGTGSGDARPMGLFQQRPSDGAGSARQLLDPVYATNAFFNRLQKVRGYRTMPVSEAAQRAQGSAFPAVQRDYVQDASTLTAAMTGKARASFSCTVDRTATKERDKLNAVGLTKRAARVRQEVERVFGKQSLGGFEPGGVRDGHMPGSAHYEGRAMDIFFRPISKPNLRLGWAMSSYLVANAERLDIETIIFDSKVWQAEDSQDGWERYEAGDRPGNRAILQHRDHVHVDVFD